MAQVASERAIAFQAAKGQSRLVRNGSSASGAGPQGVTPDPCSELKPDYLSVNTVEKLLVVTDVIVGVIFLRRQHEQYCVG
jgi:hypothetical protein